MFRTKLNDAIKDAMKNGEKDRLSVLRLMSSAIKQKDIDARPSGKGDITDDQIMQLLQTMIKQRRESISMYEKGNRPDLAAKEHAEIEVIESFLPQQMTEEEIDTVVGEAIQESAAATLKDMGAVMSLLKDKYTGKMDFGKASGIIKRRLS
jgi:uncharacterized protein YqeY